MQKRKKGRIQRKLILLRGCSFIEIWCNLSYYPTSTWMFLEIRMGYMLAKINYEWDWMRMSQLCLLDSEETDAMDPFANSVLIFRRIYKRQIQWMWFSAAQADLGAAHDKWLSSYWTLRLDRFCKLVQYLQFVQKKFETRFSKISVKRKRRRKGRLQQNELHSIWSLSKRNTCLISDFSFQRTTTLLLIIIYFKCIS